MAIAAATAASAAKAPPTAAKASAQEATASNRLFLGPYTPRMELAVRIREAHSVGTCGGGLVVLRQGIVGGMRRIVILGFAVSGLVYAGSWQCGLILVAESGACKGTAPVSGGPSLDGHCGPNFPGNQTCDGTTFGTCCSSYG